jgi:hypothetical protein
MWFEAVELTQLYAAVTLANHRYIMREDRVGPGFCAWINFIISCIALLTITIIDGIEGGCDCCGCCAAAGSPSTKKFNTAPSCFVAIFVPRRDPLDGAKSRAFVYTMTARRRAVYILASILINVYKFGLWLTA